MSNEGVSLSAEEDVGNVDAVCIVPEETDTQMDVIVSSVISDTNTEREIEVIDLTVPYNSTVTVDLTQDPTPNKPRNSRRSNNRSRQNRSNRLRQRIEVDIEDASNGSDSEDFPQVLPDFSPGSSHLPQPEDSSEDKGIFIKCPICLDGYEQITRSNRHLMSTKCGHIFCNKCIRQALKSQKVCPNCRKKLYWNQLHPLYF